MMILNSGMRPPLYFRERIVREHYDAILYFCSHYGSNIPVTLETILVSDVQLKNRVHGEEAPALLP